MERTVDGQTGLHVHPLHVTLSNIIPQSLRDKVDMLATPVTVLGPLRWAGKDSQRRTLL